MVATVLTACGIETLTLNYFETEPTVATVLTACGIETRTHRRNSCQIYSGCNSAYRLRY